MRRGDLIPRSVLYYNTLKIILRIMIVLCSKGKKEKRKIKCNRGVR